MSAIATAQLVPLSDADTAFLLKGLHLLEVAEPAAAAVDALAERLQFGDDFKNALDERVRRDERKQVLAAAVRENDARIAELNAQLDEEWIERGITSERHAASGKLVHRTRGRVFAKVVRAGDDTTPAEREAACAALKADEGTAEFVREDFHSGALGAYIKELAETYDAEQRELPEHERTPRDINDFLPAAARGLVEATDNPTISVRS